MKGDTVYCARCGRRLREDRIHVHEFRKGREIHREVHKVCATPDEILKQECRLAELKQIQEARRLAGSPMSKVPEIVKTDLEKAEARLLALGIKPTAGHVPTSILMMSELIAPGSVASALRRIEEKNA